jgi:phosphonate transport system ATP-binding protein
VTDAVVEVRNISKSYTRGRKALDDISLTVDRGEMVALIGASGSGKSTLIRHISGLVCADRDGGDDGRGGDVRVLGQTVQSCGCINGGIRSLRARIGVIFQQFNLVSRLSLLTNVVTGVLGRIPAWRGTLGLFTREEKLLAMEALRRVDMDRYAGQRASTLSGGQQQRAAIARALVQRAEVLLADEPIASLDPESARRVMEVLARINREDGITVIVSLHQVAYARKYCPRTVALRDGRVIFDGPSEALTPDFLLDLYGADSEELVMDDTLEAPARQRRFPSARVEPVRVAAMATG